MSKIIVFIIVSVAIIMGVALFSNSQLMENGNVVSATAARKAHKPTLNSEVSVIDAQMISLDNDAKNITQSVDDNQIDPTL